MSQSSYSGYVLRAPATVFDADEPMSSYRAWENRQNLLHLTDESTQHRINWVTPDASGYGIEATGTPSLTPTWSATYPHTWLATGKPANLALRLLGHHCSVRARLVPWTAPVITRNLLDGNTSSDAVFDEILDLDSSSPTEDNYLHINSAFDTPVYEQAWMSPGNVVGSDGTARPVRVCLMRLELQVLSEVAARVFGVCLRECA